MNNRILIIATALISVVVLLLGWFLGVSPKLAEAATNEGERRNIEAQNLVHEAELAALIAQFEEVDDIKERAEKLRLSLPPGADLSRFIRQLNGLGAGAGLAITDVTISQALPYVPGTVEAPPPPAAEAEGEATEGEAAVPDPTATEGQPVATSALVNETNFIAIPVSILTAGSYESTLAFLKGLQTGERLMLVTNLSVTTVVVEGQAAARGEAAVPGSVSYETNVTGYIYVLIDPTYVPPLEGDTNEDGVVDDQDLIVIVDGEVIVGEELPDEEPVDGETTDETTDEATPAPE